MASGIKLWRSAGLRLAVVYAALFTASALALVVFLWFATAGMLDRQSEAAIRTDAQGLLEQYDEGGLAALQTTIEERLAENIDDDAIYLLVNPAQRALAGNLGRWPAKVAATDQLYELTVERAGMRSLAQVRAFTLYDGSRLLVGRDVGTRAPLRALLGSALLWSVLVMAALATAGAVVMQRLFRRMIANVSSTAAAIALGDLARRVRLSGHGDEFDQLAEVINDMLDRTALLMDGVRQVSNSIAHDLRTPIARARARLEDASGHAATAEELRAAIDRAVADLDGVAAVFAALLRIAEIEAGARRSAFAPFDVAEVLAGLGELYGAVAEEGGATLAIDAPASLQVNGDRSLIQQALANLLDNAIKFSGEGCAIQLAARADGEAGHETVEIAVTDHGPGIPEADRARATHRFFRGEAARQTPGSGLGLALVDAVAQLHGGVLRLHDARPGLRAVLTLPQIPPERAG